jgi:hypothetical protein
VTEYSSSETLIALRTGVMFYAKEKYSDVKEKLK